MNAGQIIDIVREGIFVMIQLGSPIMIVALLVGLSVSLLQALTQIQEMTLSFVPKILAIFVTAIIALPFMFATLSTFTETLFRRIGQPG